VTTGPHLPTSTAHDCSGTAGNDGTEHHLALALDRCTVKANDGGSSPHLLALGGDVLEALAFEFDRIEPNMHDKLNIAAHGDSKGMATWKKLDQVTIHSSDSNSSRRVDSNAIAGHFLREYL